MLAALGPRGQHTVPCEDSELRQAGERLEDGCSAVRVVGPPLSLLLVGGSRFALGPLEHHHLLAGEACVHVGVHLLHSLGVVGGCAR